MTDSLLPLEAIELEKHETTIERGLNTFVEVGLALLAIRDGRLYRENYGTFEDYCRERWNFQRAHAYRLLDAATVVKNLSPVGDIFPASERQARPLTRLEPDLQRQAWQRAVETAPNGKITAAHVQSVVNEIAEKPAPRPEVIHISDDSYEWYTPSVYIEAARDVLGGIDLDPASSEQANQVVKAAEYYTKDDDGLSCDWFGRVFLNPPYNMPLVEYFTRKAIEAYESGKIEAAIILVNNATDTGWFHSMMEKYPVCFTRRRVQFWNPASENLATRQGQAFFYLGKDAERFTSVFSEFGIVVRKYDYPEPESIL